MLVTGATGSGKSTTLAALVDRINRTRPLHILTIEDPIEFVHARPPRGRHAARSRLRHAGVCLRPAQRAASGPGRHPHRRNARPGDDRDRARRRRNGPPRVLDAAHPRRARDHQPHRRGVPAAPAEPDPASARARAAGGRLAAPAAARRRPRPRARGRGADRHGVRPRLHRGPRQDLAHRARHRAGRRAVRHAELRPGDPARSCQRRHGHRRRSRQLGHERGRIQDAAARHHAGASTVALGVSTRPMAKM